MSEPIHIKATAEDVDRLNQRFMLAYEAPEPRFVFSELTQAAEDRIVRRIVEALREELKQR